MDIGQLTLRNSNLHKCAKDTCNALCTKEFCRHHTVRKEYVRKKVNPNVCKWETCERKCRKDFCHYHKPDTVAARNAYNKIYQSQKAN